MRNMFQQKFKQNSKKWMMGVVALFIFSFYATSQSQYQWQDPQKQSICVVRGQAWPEDTKGKYQRIPDSKKSLVTDYVWNNSLHSTGLSIGFYSNSPEIKVRYTVNRNLAMHHMPATGVSGLDLYATDCYGTERICDGKFSFNDTITYEYKNLVYHNSHSHGSEYRLYLPLYNTVTWMEIGVPDGQEFSFIPLEREKPIVVYGTSIAHGGCASRPAMAWTNIVSRNLDFPMINFGFSGSGRLDSSFFVQMAEIDARMFIIDCMPNMTHDRTSFIQKYMVKGVQILREKSQAPILIVEHDGYTNEGTSEYSASLYKNANVECKKAFETLQKMGVKNIYYLSHEEIGMDPDGLVDCVHSTDLGMSIYAKAYTKKIREILHQPVGTIRTTIPRKQRCEPDNYEWNPRHQAILALNQQRAPQILMIGNSITHFWGGEPVFSKQYGKKSWEKLFKGKVVTNMGYGCDRVENALYRVYHDELSGYEAEKIFMMIGTNNLNGDSDQDIADGISFLIKEIQYRQPKAILHIVSIYPRRNEEDHLNRLNAQIKASLQEGPLLKFVDVSKALLKEDGKIDESLFIGDGLHPNEKGYSNVAKLLKPYVD